MGKTDTLWKVVERNLLSAQDLEAVILKCHLLVETQVNAALAAKLGPAIEKVGLRFAQKLDLLACVWPEIKNISFIGPRSLYDEWKGLNSIRNKIAHQLSPDNIRDLLIEWATASLGYRLQTINRTSVLRRNIIKAVAMKIAFFSGHIDVVAHQHNGSNKAPEDTARRLADPQR
jgi:hypothetical protein